jgi:chromosome segregation ATPase
MTPRANLKILYTANELNNEDSSATFAAQENGMGQVDGVTRPRLAPNEHLREVATIVSDRPSGDVLSHTSATADVAVQRAEELGSSSAASRDTAPQQAADFQGRLGQVVRTHHTLAAQLNQAMQALDRADQNCATAATTSAQHFAQQQAALAAAKAEAATLRESLERQLATVYVRAADSEAAAERLSRREVELAEALEAQQNLQRRFSAAIILLQEQDADREATNKRLTQREAELAEATEKRLSVESQLVEAQRALGEAVRRSVDDRSTAIQEAAQRQSRFDALLREEVSKYDGLAKDLMSTRQELAQAETMLREAEGRHAVAMTTAAAQFNEQEARHQARIAEAGAARDAVSHQLQEAAAALDTARQDHLANAATAAEQFAQQEAKLREGSAARQFLEGQLAEANTALQAAEQRAATDRLAVIQRAAERDAEVAARLRQDAATRETLEQAVTAASNKLAEAETAIRNAEQRHASQMTTVTARLADQQIQYETRLAEAAASRDLVDQRLREVEASFERSRAEAAVDATAAAERLMRLEAQRVQALTNLQTLEIQLADANAARHVAEQSVAAERVAAERQAAQRQSDFEAAIAVETAGRRAVLQDLAASQQKFADSESARHHAEERHASAMTSAAAEIARETAGRQALQQDLAASQQKVAESESARRDAEARHASAMTSAAAQFEAQIARETAGRQAVAQDLAASQQKVAESESARRDAEARHASAMTSAAAQFEAQIARETASRQAVAQDLSASQQKVAETESALRNAEASHASAMTSALAQFASRRTELETRLSQALSAHAALEQARLDAEQRHASEIKTAAEQFAERQREFETLLGQTTAVSDGFEVRLCEAEATLVRIHDDRAAEAIEVAEKRTQLESKLATTTEKLATATANGETLERRLAEITNALHTAEELVVSERVVSSQRATERQGEFDARLSHELATRTTIEQALAATRQDLLKTETALRDGLAQHAVEMTTASNELSARQREYTTRLAEAAAARSTLEQKLVDADQRHAAALKSAATHLTEQQSQYETRLAEVMTAREIISGQLHETETTLARIRQESEATAIASAERIRQRESELAAAATDRQVLEGKLAETETALKNTEAQAFADRTAMQQQSAQRRAAFDAQLAREIDARNREIEARNRETEARTIVERNLAETRVAAEQTRQRLLDQSAALTTEMRDLEVRLTQELAREVADYEGKLEDLQTQLGALNAERDGLRESLANSHAELESLSLIHEDTKENFERSRQAKETELQRLADDYAAVCQTLEKVRADAVQTLERVGSEHAAELASIKALVAERDGQLNDQTARHRQQVEKLHGSVNAIMQDFEEMRRHRDKLQIEADRVLPLTKRLEANREESQRQFDGSPIGILRCNEAGELKDANRALISALGYRTVDELRALGSVASLFETPDDYRWFIENRETPSEIDWIWKKKDGGRLMMRLRAVRVSADVVDIVAENVTALRAVEERLRRAQRLEAVGRLASEVADNCDILLRNVSREGQHWLATVAGNTAQRQQGELILGDVTRAAGFLQQLSGYGSNQTSVRAVVDVNTVLRDLGSVLKRVAGDDIELVLPKKGSALNVDVDGDRVERILVNITAYGRERMPSSGGRLIFELARVVVDPGFLLKYPNVRAGAHALISVTKVRTPALAGSIEGTAIGARSERPGVDLGLLQSLIDDCGGHLWMKAEPGGDMELKIHLPLRSADPSRTAEVVRSVGRSVSSWFQS